MLVMQDRSKRFAAGRSGPKVKSGQTSETGLCSPACLADSRQRIVRRVRHALRSATPASCKDDMRCAKCLEVIAYFCVTQA